MPRRRGRATKRRAVEKDAVEEELQAVKEDSFVQKAERQIAAMRAIRDIEIEQMRTKLQLLRSNFSEEELQVPVKQFFEEKLPNLALVRNEQGRYEVLQKNSDADVSRDQFDGRNVHASLFHAISMMYPSCSSAVPPFEFSTNSVKTAVVGAENLQISRFALEELSDTQMIDHPDTLQTPGTNSYRVPVGMTPKTVRLPKPGEVLLSVHGSPLGVFNEDNMETIHESEDSICMTDS